jgi:hypothetical protein
LKKGTDIGKKQIERFLIYLLGAGITMCVNCLQLISPICARRKNLEDLSFHAADYRLDWDNVLNAMITQR